MAKKMTVRIWILVIAVALSLIGIFGIPPKFIDDGALVTSVTSNTTAFEQGLRKGQIITSVDGKNVESAEDYIKAIQNKFPVNENVETTIKTQNSEFILFSDHAPNITVAKVLNTNLQTGLDISGGARALVKPKSANITSKEMQDLIEVTRNRFNVYGISDVDVSAVTDLSGNKFMLVKVAGATPEDMRELVSQQGKFRAKIGNKTVFTGNDEDISSISQGGRNTGIQRCQTTQQGGQYFCNFAFTIYLTNEAAQRHADITSNLSLNGTNSQYLEKPLNLYVDGQLVNSLQIGADLKGQVTTQISISGSGTGQTRNEAYQNALSEMKELQTILKTGSLPYKLEIVRLDSVSPLLGNNFIKAIFLAGLAALVLVALVVLTRYRKVKPALALLATSLSEIVIILGIASLINWNLDLPSIAGILATIGTGIDQQIIVLDESRQKTSSSVGQKMKRALGIIIGAYFTALVAMVPLIWAGAGLLKGFAITTIIGITAGVLITRPAFVDIIKNIESK
ncbi:MAG: PDZ domain-containing protein [Candidatus Pacearchaeota archaeon]